MHMLNYPFVLLIFSGVVDWRIRCTQSIRGPRYRLIINVGVVYEISGNSGDGLVAEDMLGIKSKLGAGRRQKSGSRLDAGGKLRAGRKRQSRRNLGTRSKLRTRSSSTPTGPEVLG